MLFAVFILVSPVLNAQKNKIQTAWNYYKYDDLDKAIEAIEEATKHETTSGMPKTWYYRGLIYQKTHKHEKFGNLDPDALKKAAESYKKALEIDPEYEFKSEINQNILSIGNQMFGRGVEHFNNKDFGKALNSFENVLSIAPNDTLATLNAAYSAEKSDNKAKAKQYYERLISMGYKEPKIYIFLSSILKAENDSTAALNTIQAGRKLFPGDNNLVIEELNIYLYAGKDQEALESLNIAIQGDPNNHNLHFAKGTVLDKTGKKSEAAIAYKKAIELSPDYFDAYYNLGAMYFNEAAELANKANEIKSNTEYAKAKAVFDAKFKEAMPYLEKAHQLNPDDTNTMISLKQLYARLNETAKYEKINSQLKGK
jgi:tetratricopeptide (TPR) repeat protein